MTTPTSPSARNATLLNQLVAIEKGVKTRAKDVETRIYQQMQRGAVDAALSGQIRTYQPLDDDGVKLPDERSQVQVHVQDLLTEAAQAISRLFDVTGSKDETNTGARGDVRLGERVLLSQVPVTFLMTLEKELVDWRTMIGKLPVLDIAETWTRDADANAYRSEPRQTTRSIKEPAVQVLYPATDKHPAQVQAFTRDVVVGFWTVVKLSGAIPASQRGEMLERVEALIAAVKMAREQANMTEVTDVAYGVTITNYLLNG